MPHSTAPDLPMIRLSILATTDLHGHLLSYDYFADHPADHPALSRISSLVNEVRGEAANVLLFDNGDFLQGTPLSDLVSELSPEGFEHPLVNAMNRMRYDAIALGNHEFNVSLPRLTEVLERIEAPLLCANLHATSAAPVGLGACWRPRTILCRQVVDTAGQMHDLKIGVFGVAPPQVLNWDHSRVAGKLTAADSLQAARRSFEALRAEGADIVIGLAHTGLSDGPEQPGMENTGRQIAATDGLDALVLGHTHLRFPGGEQPKHPDIHPDSGAVHGTPTVQPGAGGSVLGRMELSLELTGGGWRVTGHEVTLVDSLGAGEDAGFVSALTPAHDWVLGQLRNPVGEITRPIHSGLALLPGCPTVRIVAEALAAYGERQLADTEWSGLPVLAAAAPQKCGGRGGPGHFTDIPAGVVALNHVTDLQAFPNDVSALRLTGAELAEWLEMAVSLYHQIRPGVADQPLRRDAFPIYNCDAIYGLRYEVDLSQPPRFDAAGAVLNPVAQRIHDLTWQGAPLRPDQEFALVVNNYRAGGGGGFPNSGPTRILFEEDTKIRDLLVARFANGDPSVSDAPPPWRFRPIAGASAWFDTAHAVRDHLNEQPRDALEIIGDTPEGYLRLRRHFD